MTTTDCPIRLDSDERRVWVDDQQIELSKHQFDVLEVLLEKPRKVYRRGELMTRVWGSNWIDDRSLDTVVYQIRKRLDSRQSLIRTVRGVGYAVDF